MGGPGHWFVLSVKKCTGGQKTNCCEWAQLVWGPMHDDLYKSQNCIYYQRHCIVSLKRIGGCKQLERRDAEMNAMGENKGFPCGFVGRASVWDNNSDCLYSDVTCPWDFCSLCNTLPASVSTDVAHAVNCIIKAVFIGLNKNDWKRQHHWDRVYI